MGDDPTPLSHSLDRVARHLGMATPSILDRVVEVWPEVAGVLASHATPVAIHHRNLLITTADPALIEAIRWRGTTIVEQLSARLGTGDEITGIEVRQSR